VNQFVTWRLALISNFSLNLANFAPGEVSTAAYDEQQTYLQLIVVIADHGVWPVDFNDNKNR
jgi:hypothetical protein